MLRLFLLVLPAFAANCGTSTIPYSLEVLPDGATVLGCARPTCFGWDGVTGNWATHDAEFINKGEYTDGFLRSAVTQRPPFDPFRAGPQTSVCFPSASCAHDQWVGGVFHNSVNGLSMICCSYTPLMDAEARGTAPLKAGEIYVGGEVEENSKVAYFDYIRNIRHIHDDEGRIVGYNVDVGRIRCYDPPAPTTQAPAVQEVAQVPQLPQQPAPVQNVIYQPQYVPAPYVPQSFVPFNLQPTSYWCFAPDSMVLLSDGTEKRMDQLELDDWVASATPDMKNLTTTPIKNWLHRLPEQEAEFVVISTRSGKKIKLTPRHLIYKADCYTAKSTIVAAEEVRNGDCLLSSEVLDDSLKLVAVDSVIRQNVTGIYAPLTDNGKIVVDGIVVSCYSEVANEGLVSSLYNKFVQCDTRKSECHLQDTRFRLVLQMADLLLPSLLL